jgi:uncharacterized RDD family membrane protein YckC
VLVDQASRTISIYRFDEQHRAIAAAIENWDHIDLLDVLNRQAGVPLTEANRIAAALREQHSSLGSLAERLEQSTSQRRGWSSLENAGIPLRFVAVLLDAMLVFAPLGIVVAMMSGGGYAERGPGYANAGVNVGGNVFWVLLALGIGYYVVCEAAAGVTLGKRMVGIRVVDAFFFFFFFFFFYLVGFLFALTSTRGQRLGDRAAHTIVVRR